MLEDIVRMHETTAALITPITHYEADELERVSSMLVSASHLTVEAHRALERDNSETQRHRYVFAVQNLTSSAHETMMSTYRLSAHLLGQGHRVTYDATWQSDRIGLNAYTKHLEAEHPALNTILTHDTKPRNGAAHLNVEPWAPTRVTMQVPLIPRIIRPTFEMTMARTAYAASRTAHATIIPKLPRSIGDLLHARTVRKRGLVGIEIMNTYYDTSDLIEHAYDTLRTSHDAIDYCLSCS